MGRKRAPYSLFKLKGDRKNPVYYFTTYGVDGKRTSPRSTFTANKVEAQRFVQEQLQTGIITSGSTFKEFAKDFFKPDGWYLKNRSQIRGGAKSIGAHYTRQSILEKHVLPHFGNKRLEQITKDDIENWRTSLKDEGIKNSSVNSYFGILRVILNEAERRDKIIKNPVKKIEAFENTDSIEKGEPKPAEWQLLFSDTSLWDSELIFTFNLLASTIGARKGELAALQKCDFDEINKRLTINHNWLFKQKVLKAPKNGKAREDITMPEYTLGYFLKLVQARKNPEDFIFSLDDGKTPLTDTIISKSFKRTMKRAGIDIKSRNITFHSWRRYTITRLRYLGVSDYKIMRLTGHRSLEMSLHYTGAPVLDEMTDVRKAQETLTQRENVRRVTA